ncbi:MAG: efflux RND transporter periplasmic adaptor subunit [Gemmatimonadota bacterium]|jgi:RND family efflux transporter MFP subunit|nr:efflux RND transporter periplasmic adaptor subunit [Gemmatimonadota bacterium]
MKIHPKVLLPVLVVALGAIGAVTLVKTRRAVRSEATAVPPPLVRVMEVETSRVRLDVYSRGMVEAEVETDLVARVAGEVMEVSPSFVAGGFFDDGDLLLRIDPADYELAVVQAEAAVAQAWVRLLHEEGEAEVARADWERLGGADAPDALVLRLPHVAEARAQHAAAEALLGRARLDLDRTVVRAPYDGQVRAKAVDVGGQVAPGTPLGRIYGSEAALVRLPVPVEDMAFVDTAAEPAVRLTGDFAGRTHEWSGVVARAEGEIDPRTRTVKLVARIADPMTPGANGRPPLMTGLFVEARVEGLTMDDAVVLPRSVLRGGDRVLLVEGDQLRYRSVGVVRVHGEDAVIGSGLADGDLVCLSAMAAPVEGMTVRTVLEEIPGGAR